MPKKNLDTANKKFLSVRDKLEFVQKNCKEPDLFEDLKQLFRAKGFDNVTITHGNQEYGKDLVFSAVDGAFGTTKWYAAIVKNKNASQNDFVTGGEIATQIQLSFKHPYLNNKGEKINISGVFIIINGAISFNAKNILSNFLEPALSEHIQIWDYQGLAEQIEKHIRDLYLDKIEPVINIYTKAQVSKLSDISATNQLFDLKVDDFDELFINVQTTYSKKLKKLDDYVSFDGDKKENKITEDVDGATEILNSSDNFIIHGIATSGKSILLRRIGIKSLQPRGGLPNAVFFLEFSKIPLAILSGKINFKELIQKQYEDLSGGETFKAEDFHKIYLLFDAIDEIKSNDIKKNILENINDLKDNPVALNVQYIVTIRNLEILQKEKILLDFEKIELLPFNLGQALKLVNKIIPNNKSKSETFVKALKNSQIGRAHV